VRAARARSVRNFCCIHGLSSSSGIQPRRMGAWRCASIC